MKKILLTLVALAGCFTMQAQGFDFGVKAGANFANFNGDIDSDGITSFHAGAVLELSFTPTFSIQAEGLFNSVGAEAKYEETVGGAVVTGARDLNLDYISVPVMAKFYIMPEFISVMAGPQFSFLVNEAEEAFETKSFDLGATGGVEVIVVGGLFAQARYTAGLINISDEDDFDVKNSAFQLSVGYRF
jgi:hypothetical protein